MNELVAMSNRNSYREHSKFVDKFNNNRVKSIDRNLYREHTNFVDKLNNNTMKNINRNLYREHTNFVDKFNNNPVKSINKDFNSATTSAARRNNEFISEPCWDFNSATTSAARRNIEFKREPVRKVSRVSTSAADEILKIEITNKNFESDSSDEEEELQAINETTKALINLRSKIIKNKKDTINQSFRTVLTKQKKANKYELLVKTLVLANEKIVARFRKLEDEIFKI